jgi:hypothetical protein
MNSLFVLGASFYNEIFGRFSGNFNELSMEHPPAQACRLHNVIHGRLIIHS